MSAARAGLSAVWRRELAGYFQTPAAYVFIAVFLLSAGGFAFYLGDFFNTNRADLDVFFVFHPWLHLVFMPALAMRLWAEDVKTGAIEILMTLPVPVWAAVLAKFLAAWCVAGVALALTAPLWVTVNYLGSPDNGAIAIAYAGSFLAAGAYLALGMAMSALTPNQVIAFVLAAFIGFLLTVTGVAGVLDPVGAVFGPRAAEFFASLSLQQRFESLQRGVIDLPDLVFFLSFIGVWLAACGLAVSARRGG
ncbi:MAG: ABC transporter permease [Maricaulaceae bacterium]